MHLSGIRILQIFVNDPYDVMSGGEDRYGAEDEPDDPERRRPSAAGVAKAGDRSAAPKQRHRLRHDRLVGHSAAARSLRRRM